MELSKRVLRYVKPYKGRLILAIISMLFVSFFQIFFISKFQKLIDTIIKSLGEGKSTLGELNLIIVVMLSVFFFRGFFQYGEKYLSEYVAQNAIKDLRNELYNHLQSLSLDFYGERKTGEIMSRATNDVSLLQGAIVSGAIGVFSQFFQLVGGIGKLFYDNWRLTLLAFIIFPIIAYVIDKFSKKIRKVSKEAQIKIGDISDILQETISGIRVVKSFAREEYEYNRFKEENYYNFRANMKNSQLKAVLTPITEFLASISFVIVLWYGGHDVVQGKMTAGELIGYFTLLLMITNPLKSITRLSGTIQRALAAADRIFEIMDIEPTIKDSKNAKRLDKVKGFVEFDNLTFSYKEGEVALRGIKLKAKPGEVVALVGTSGAGKSTLVNMIPRFYDPNKGLIKLDGIDIKELKVDSLREKIGIVPQETVLFGGSIRSNILYGRLDATEEEVIEAAKAANAHNFIMDFPDGYDSRIGERGAGLSGGQKQRIAIARAILKNPAILILDEATSALDTESEALVQEALDRLMRNRTTFVIAHRLSTILDADKIVVMEKGKIVEAGTHKELLSLAGAYKNLYNIQFNKQSGR